LFIRSWLLEPLSKYVLSVPGELSPSGDINCAVMLKFAYVLD